MISLMAANDSAAAVAALGSVPVAAAAQIGGHICAGRTGQYLPLTSTGRHNERTSAVALNSVIRLPATTYGDFRVDLDQRASDHRAAFTTQRATEGDCAEEEENSRMKLKTASIDEMDDDESYLSVPGDEKFAAFRQTAISGKMANKVCRVCGDRALGYNFNVVSCESCKAFFRRNALKKKEFRCPFNDNCDVTAFSRRFCQKCRLRKCFEVGMKKEWIMSEEQRLQKRKRIEENRQKRHTSSGKGRRAATDDRQDEASMEDPPSSTKATRSDQQQNLTNAGFSPGSNPSTPIVTGLGTDFSPPDSNGPSHADHKRLSEGQTCIPPLTVISSPRSVSHLSLESRAAVEKKSTSEGCCERPQGCNNSTPRFGESMKLEVPRLNGCADTENLSLSIVADQSAALFPNSPHQLFGSLDAKLSFGAAPTGRGCGLPLAAPSIQQQALAIDNSTITIPKAVLINLINQCYQKQREHFDMANTGPPPPVVVRAHRLYTDDGMSSEHELYKCICRCTCGAKRSGSCIGPKLVDRGVGPDGDEYQETEEKSMDVQERSSEPCGHETALMSLPPVNMEIIESVRSPAAEKLDYSGLTVLEELKLRELFIANQVMIEDPDEENGSEQKTSALACSSSNDDPIVGRANEELTSHIDPTDVIHMTDLCVRRIIKMCKRLSAFKSLCQEDQIALLKGGCTELMILRGVMTFIPSKECWRPVGWKNSLLSLDVMKGVKGNVYEEHKKYLHSFRDEWRTCDALMLCLAAITLFNPARPSIVHVEAVQMEQELYIKLLKRYLDLMYGVGTTASEEAFQELLNRVVAVGRLNDYAATIFVDVNPRDVEPLLIEIFDLK